MSFHSSTSSSKSRLLVYAEGNTLLYKVDKSQRRESSCFADSIICNKTTFQFQLLEYLPIQTAALNMDKVNTQTFPFLSLPPEVRNMIYRYLLSTKYTKRDWILGPEVSNTFLFAFLWLHRLPLPSTFHVNETS